jgi:hypothetical protein
MGGEGPCGFTQKYTMFHFELRSEEKKMKKAWAGVPALQGPLSELGR